MSLGILFMPFLLAIGGPIVVLLILDRIVYSTIHGPRNFRAVFIVVTALPSGRGKGRYSDFGYTGLYNYSSGLLDGTTSGGYFWSCTAGSADHARYPAFSSSNVSPQYGNLRGHGFPLRCVGKEGNALHNVL